jgi:hypothetical protein
MLSNGTCYGCGRRVRLSTAIQPPRCPACRLSSLSSVPETRPCLRCFVSILASSPNSRCVRCEASLSSNQSYALCYDCQVPFPARPGVMRCLDCRLRRSNVVQRPINFHHSHGIAFDPTLNSFQPPSTPTNPPQLKRRRSTHPGPPHSTPAPVAAESEKQSSVIEPAVGFLLQEHESRVFASSLFPPDISNSNIRLSIARFEKEMTVASRDVPCSSCGMLIPSTDTRRVLDEDPVLGPLEGLLDRCGYIDGFWNLCSGCYAALLRGSAPKFSAENKINVILCQHYPAEELIKERIFTLKLWLQNCISNGKTICSSL